MRSHARRGQRRSGDHASGRRVTDRGRESLPAARWPRTSAKESGGCHRGQSALVGSAISSDRHHHRGLAHPDRGRAEPMLPSAARSFNLYARHRARDRNCSTTCPTASMSGHTDATQYFGERGYSNWELSADRGNAVRRELLAGACRSIASRVVGLASSVLLNQGCVRSINRVSIIVMNKRRRRQPCAMAARSSQGLHG